MFNWKWPKPEKHWVYIKFREIWEKHITYLKGKKQTSLFQTQIYMLQNANLILALKQHSHTNNINTAAIHLQISFAWKLKKYIIH